MAEVSGTLIWKFTEAVHKELDDQSSTLSQANVESMLRAAGLDPAANDLKSLMPLNDGDYAHEGLEARQEYLLVYPFDEKYMDLMRVLVERGDGIEIIGGINHEYGPREYYVRAEDTRFVGYADLEADEGPDPAEVRAEFGNLVPSRVRKVFSDVF